MKSLLTLAIVFSVVFGSVSIANATHCQGRQVQKLVYGQQDIQFVVVSPHQNLAIVQDYDYHQQNIVIQKVQKVQKAQKVQVKQQNIVQRLANVMRGRQQVQFKRSVEFIRSR